MYHEPIGKIIGNVMFMPAFAEEMNKSRRMISSQARRLAEVGYRVIVPDPYGTGDSDGDIGQASVEIWRNDLIAILQSDEQVALAPLWLWGHRLGALLVLDAATFLPWQLAGALLWSPCCDGNQFMSQFMRIRSMAGMVSGSANRESLADIRKLLESEKKLEIAGYELSAELVAAIEQITIDSISNINFPVVHWFELNAGGGRPVSPGVQRRVSALTESGSNINVCVVEGPDFWATAELADAPNLLDATVRALS